MFIINLDITSSRSVHIDKIKTINYHDRIIIENSLTKSISFNAIERELDKNYTTFSIEIVKNPIFCNQGVCTHVFKNYLNRFFISYVITIYNG